jgi:hypothetical protein
MRLRPSALLLGLGLALASFSPAPPGGPAGRPSAPPEPVAADPAQLAAEERALQTAAQGDDAAAALNFFRKRTPGEAQREHLQALVRDLADDSFEVRQKASADLVAAGPVAAALLRAAARGDDAEAARRARTCLAQMHRDGTAAIVLAGAGLVIRRRPAGAVAVLLAYLPFAEDEGVAEELRTSLAALTAKDGKPEPALLQALASADAAQRAEAGVVLARARLADTGPAVHQLLDDEDATVRLRVGRALVEAKDRDAIPTLIALFGDLAGDERWEVEELLERIAGEDAPAVPRNDTPDVRRRRRGAWLAWWQAHGDSVDLARLPAPPRPAGRTLLLEADLSLSDGLVSEVGADGRLLRRVAGLQGPVAVEGLPEGHLLVAEYGGRRVRERDFSGKVVWEKKLPANPVAVQRLANGNTFVACRNRLLEIDRDGREISDRRRPARDVLGARRHPDGSTALITHDGLCRWLDAGGQETRRFPVGGPHALGVGIDVLPNKRVLVPCFGENRVAEYAAAGEVLWQATVAGAASAERLPNGHTLVGSTTPPRVVELDRAGKVVWHYRPDQTDRILLQATRRP